MEVGTCKSCNDVSNTAKNLYELVEKSRSCDVLSIMKQIEKSFSDNIKDFFSDSHGEGERIRIVYKKVSDFTARYPRINIQDINWSNHLYKEYNDGMRMFISNELQSSDTSDTSVMKERIETFTEKDKAFIESLFEGGSNVKTAEGVRIKDALCNLEVLIDFIKEMEDRTSFIESSRIKIEDFGNKNEDVAEALMKLYLLSNIRFSEKLISSIFESFEQIVSSMNQPRYNIQPAVKEEVKRFQLF